MNKNFVIVRTGGGRRYAERIANSIHWLNEHKYPQHTFNTDIVSVNELRDFFASPRTRLHFPINTIIYSRAAYPERSGWMSHLFYLRKSGFTVINDPEVLYLTSNKLECSLRLQDHFPHPRTWEYSKSFNNNEYHLMINDINNKLDYPDGLIVKPLTSLEQGANVKIIKLWGNSPSGLTVRDEINLVPGNNLVIQERVPYTAIYRVVVIGGRALPYSFVDRPTPERWKVSVCLNRTSMEFVPDPDPELLRLGENIQRFIGGEINFIDIFETEPGQFVISEINTACNLHIHEMLARNAGHPVWNIHYRIAKYLVERSLA